MNLRVREVLFVLTAIVFNCVGDAGDHILEYALDENSIEGFEVKHFFVFSDGLDEITPCGTHVLEDIPADQLFGDVIEGELWSLHYVEIASFLLVFNVCLLQLFPPFGHDFDLIVDVVYLWSIICTWLIRGTLSVTLNRF